MKDKLFTLSIVLLVLSAWLSFIVTAYDWGKKHGIEQVKTEYAECVKVYKGENCIAILEVDNER